MPASFTRLLLALALALTIPVQGFAAATAGFCMLGHHDASMHSHESDVAPHPHQDHDSPSTTTHCAPCMGCCAAAVIALSVALIAVANHADAAAAFGLPAYAGIQLDTLDRPPLAS